MRRRTYKPIDVKLALEGGRSFRTKRRAFLDALDVIDAKWPTKGQSARVSVNSMRLPSGDVASLVVIIAGAPEGPNVGLPFCSAIRASDSYGNSSRYDPVLFDGATLDEYGNATLSNGLHFHACEVVPMNLPTEWAAHKHDVVCQAICFMRAEVDCYLAVACRPELDWAGYLPARRQGGTSKLSAFDKPEMMFVCYRSAGKLEMKAEKFEAFVAFHQQNTPRKRQLSRQNLANILRDAGVRVPIASFD